ncbi:MAG TPA: pyridoxamine 5'-phosphate oxidase family protein [Acidimicrobiia bacterium]
MVALPQSGRAGERLRQEIIGWLTTVTRSGQPQSSPVWFAVHDDAIYVQSRPLAAKLSNIRAHSKVSFHLDSDGLGGDIVTIDGEAEILDGLPSGLYDTYLAKYERVIRERLGTTPEEMIEQYNTTVRVAPRRVRAW